MKSLKTLVCVTSFALCFGAASMASAATIGPVGQTFSTPGGTITVKSPSSFQAPVTCSINFTGVVNANGTATINGATVGGSNMLCSLPKMKNFPTPGWVLTAASTTAGTVTNVGYTISSLVNTDCGPSNIQVAWNGTTLSATNQALSGNCTVSSLSVTPTPALVITP
jgi:hypothetical protein